MIRILPDRRFDRFSDRSGIGGSAREKRTLRSAPVVTEVTTPEDRNSRLFPSEVSESSTDINHPRRDEQQQPRENQHTAQKGLRERLHVQVELLEVGGIRRFAPVE